MSEEVRFETTGVLDEAFLRKTFKYSISPQWCWIRISRMLLTSLPFLLTSEFLGRQTTLILLAAFWIAFVLITIWMLRRSLDVSVKSFRERYDGGTCEITTSCIPEGIRTVNRTNGNVNVLKYEHIRSLRVVEDAFFLTTEAAQLLTYFTNGLTRQEKTELIAFLKEKRPQLKIYG